MVHKDTASGIGEAVMKKMQKRLVLTRETLLAVKGANTGTSTEFWCPNGTSYCVKSQNHYMC